MITQQMLDEATRYSNFAQAFKRDVWMSTDLMTSLPEYDLNVLADIAWKLLK